MWTQLCSFCQIVITLLSINMYTMKEFLVFAFAFTFTCSLRAQFNGNSWAEVDKNGKGVLDIIYFEQAGLIENNKAGQKQGVCVDMLNHFTSFVESKYKKKITLKLFREEDGNKFYQLIDRNPYLLGVGNISITQERKLKYKFTPAFMANKLQLITNSATQSITTTNELTTKLNGYTAYVLASSISKAVLGKIKKSYLPTVKIIEKPTALLTLEAVSNDPKSFTIIDFTELLTAKRKNLDIKWHPLEMEKTEDLGFIMPKKSDWDVIWGEFLTAQYLDSTDFKKSIIKNFGPSFLSTLQVKTNQ